MGKLDLPLPPKPTRKGKISMPPSDWVYCRQLADAARCRGDLLQASVSAQIRLALANSRRLRHDFAGPLNAVRIIAAGLRHGTLSPARAADQLEAAVRFADAIRTGA